MNYFPFFLGLEQKSTAIIGAGKIALAKLKTIFEYTNNITVIAKEIDDLLLNFAQENNIKIIKNSYHKKYLKNHYLVIGATNDTLLNKQISKDARAAKQLVNIVDNPKISDFIFGAIVRRSNLNIAISSSATSPVLSRLTKQKIEKILPNNLSDLDNFIKEHRELVKNNLRNIQSRRLFWQEIIEGNIGVEVLSGNVQKAQLLLKEKLLATSNKNKSSLYLIGAGAGDPELLTLKAVNLLSKVDVVLYDRLVAEPILEFARKDAIKINVGKKRNFHKYSQAEINNLIRKYLLEGNIVARLKGGDPSIFAHLYEEIDVAKELDVSYQIVPGISAVSAAAAYNAIPLTARDIATSLRILTLYKQDIENEQYWQDLSRSKDTLAFYMSSNNAKFITQKLIKYGKNSATKIAVIEQASTKYQKTYISDLANFEQKDFVSPSIIIIGEVVNFYKKYNNFEEVKVSKKYFRELHV